MLAKLLALLMQSKLAAVSTAFVLGTTGALVGATTHDGLTTAASPEANEQTETPQSDAVLTNALGDEDDSDVDVDDEDVDQGDEDQNPAEVDEDQNENDDEDEDDGDNDDEDDGDDEDEDDGNEDDEDDEDD